MDGIETNIVDISEDALDELFNETPEKTVNADTLIGGKKKQAPTQNDEEDEDDVQEEEAKSKKKAVPNKKQQAAVPQPQSNDIEDIDLDELDEQEPAEEDDEEEEEDDKAKKGTKRSEKAEAPKEEEASEQGDVKSVLKSTVDYLIQSGQWQDFEGREELDIDEETYAKLVSEQDRLRVTGMFEELVDSTGPFGKAIIEFVKNGGNPDEIIDLFKEQKQIESIKTDSPEGQKELIKHYYTEVLGWKPEKADKYISNLVLSNELEPESQEVKELFSNYYKKETERLNNERSEFTRQQKEAEQAFESNIRNTIKERRDLSQTERKAVEDYLLTYDQRLPNGNMVNKFYVNFAKMQANPADYVDLVLFVMDKQKFVQKISVKEKSEAAAKQFNFIKGNGAVTSKKGSNYEQIKKNEKVSNFDWGIPKK